MGSSSRVAALFAPAYPTQAQTGTEAATPAPPQASARRSARIQRQRRARRQPRQSAPVTADIDDGGVGAEAVRALEIGFVAAARQPELRGRTRAQCVERLRRAVQAAGAGAQRFERRAFEQHARTGFAQRLSQPPRQLHALGRRQRRRRQQPQAQSGGPRQRRPTQVGRTRQAQHRQHRRPGECGQRQQV
jgi:hypothetical protein